MGQSPCRDNYLIYYLCPALFCPCHHDCVPHALPSLPCAPPAASWAPSSRTSSKLTKRCSKQFLLVVPWLQLALQHLLLKINQQWRCGWHHPIAGRHQCWLVMAWWRRFCWWRWCRRWQWLHLDRWRKRWEFLDYDVIWCGVMWRDVVFLCRLLLHKNFKWSRGSFMFGNLYIWEFVLFTKAGILPWLFFYNQIKILH